MKKRAPVKKQTATRKSAAKKKTASKPARKSAAGKPAPRASSPSSESGQGIRYTPAPLKTDGSPAFRYPPQ
jgi:hypothetical protein